MDRLFDISSKRPPLRVAVVGAGRSALLTHLPAWLELSDQFRVTAVCDFVRERRERILTKYPQAKAYRLLSDMLGDPDIDLVYIGLPTADHMQAALDSLERNHWVVLESPMAVTHEKALALKATSQRMRNKLYVSLPGYFSPEFRLARMALADVRLGGIYEAFVRKLDYLRRDDWQTVKRCQGGATWYEGPEAVQQAVTLLGSTPVQLWSELKRVVALGDAEDTAHIVLKSRGNMTSYIDIGGGRLDTPQPAFEIRGSMGYFTVMPGATTGTIRYLDPKVRLSRRRVSVRTPPLADRHEKLTIREETIKLPDNVSGAVGFWRAIHESVTKALPFPIMLEDVTEGIRYLELVKRLSPFAK